jgi:hypothetical protein
MERLGEKGPPLLYGAIVKGTPTDCIECKGGVWKVETQVKPKTNQGMQNARENGNALNLL